MSFEMQHHEMVKSQIEARGIKDSNVLKAMMEVPREKFVEKSMKAFAYSDSALPIEAGQTISQPYIVALMASALKLKPTDIVLDIGTGSGYAAAIMSRIVSKVYTVERIKSLADHAKEVFEELGYSNIEVLCADGTNGWPEYAPYDAISVAASSPQIPMPLLNQLKAGGIGRLILPLGSAETTQRLCIIYRESEDYFVQENLEPVRFVPLIGEHGQQ